MPILGREWLALLGLLTMLLAAPAARADGAEPADEVATGLPLTAPVRATLGAVQENWLQWDSSFLRGDELGAEAAVSDLLHTAEDIGMDRLPDLSVAALVRATESAAEGNVARARWAIPMAEKLDPGRPENAMASATVARLEGHYLTMLADEARGYLRLPSVPLLGRIWRENVLLAALAAVAVAGALFLALLLARYGGWLVGDLAEVASQRMPVPSAYFLALVAVIAPILIPSAWVALPFYWSILLFGYASRHERAVLCAVLAAVLAAPLVLDGQAERVRIELTPEVRALRGLEEGRLYGTLLRDIGRLSAEFPDEPAVRHLVADVHQSLGQLEHARVVYEQVVAREPDNFGAHNNLGIYYLGQRNLKKAIEHFERSAALAPPDRLEPYRNLYVLYRDYLAFEEAERVLTEVRSRDPEAVVSWMQDGGGTVKPVQEGYARAPEIIRLVETQAVSEAGTSGATWIDPVALLPPVGFAAIALALWWLLYRRGAFRQRRPATLPRWALRWIPALASLTVGRAYRTYLSLVVLVVILLVPRMGQLGFPLPWGIEPGVAVLWVAATALLALYLSACWVASRREVLHVD